MPRDEQSVSGTIASQRDVVLTDVDRKCLLVIPNRVLGLYRIRKPRIL